MGMSPLQPLGQHHTSAWGSPEELKPLFAFKSLPPFPPEGVLAAEHRGHEWGMVALGCGVQPRPGDRPALLCPCLPEPFACCTSLATAQPATFCVLFSNTLDYCCKSQFKACLSLPWLVVLSLCFSDSREWELNPLWLSLWPICPEDYGCSNTWVAGTAEQHLSVKSVIF